MQKHMEQGCEFDDLPMAINTHSKLYISATGQVFVRKPEDTETVEFVQNIADADRKAALDAALNRLESDALSSRYWYGSTGKDVELIRSALQSPSEGVKATLDAMSDKQRMDIFSNYCTECGDKNPSCQCWNDE